MGGRCARPTHACARPTGDACIEADRLPVRGEIRAAMSMQALQ